MGISVAWLGCRMAQPSPGRSVLIMAAAWQACTLHGIACCMLTGPMHVCRVLNGQRAACCTQPTKNCLPCQLCVRRSKVLMANLPQAPDRNRKAAMCIFLPMVAAFTASSCCEMLGTKRLASPSVIGMRHILNRLYSLQIERDLVRAALYPPEGKRSYGLTRWGLQVRAQSSLVLFRSLHCQPHKPV